MSIFICFSYIVVWYVELNYHDFLIDRLLISSDKLLLVTALLPLILALLITIVPFLIHDAKILISGRKNSDNRRSVIPGKYDDSNLLVRLVRNIIDEEGQGYLDDLKSEWITLELSQEQLNIKEIMFIADYYWGRFIARMRFPRFSAFTRR